MEEQEKKVTMSEQVRQLHDLGMKTKDIAKELGIRYQFAYNVISAYLKERELASHQLAVTVEHPPQPVVPQTTPQPETINPEPEKPAGPFGTPLKWGDAVKPDTEQRKSVLANLFRK